jgi:hypothetical protein
LNYSRRGFYCAYPDGKLGCFLEAHERAFEHFGAHTREHLYDRPRTVCRPTEAGRVIWNPTFNVFNVNYFFGRVASRANVTLR